ncbi:hypothetical protein KI387_008683, partial [Taxus chinensis]
WRSVVSGAILDCKFRSGSNTCTCLVSDEPSQKQIRAIHDLAYRGQTEIFDSADNSWKGDARAWTKRTKSLNSTTFIEFVTSPNNPDALLKEGVLEGENVRTIYDYAYYWPHFTAISHQAEEDIMLFTLSKLTGHAGSRLGQISYSSTS